MRVNLGDSALLQQNLKMLPIPQAFTFHRAFHNPPLLIVKMRLLIGRRGKSPVTLDGDLLLIERYL